VCVDYVLSELRWEVGTGLYDVIIINSIAEKLPPPNGVCGAGRHCHAARRRRVGGEAIKVCSVRNLCIDTAVPARRSIERQPLRVCSNVSLYAPRHAHMRTAPQSRRTHSSSSLPPLRGGVKLGWRACCRFVSVHRLPRPTARSLPFSYGSTGDELAPRTFYLQGLQVWNGMMVLLGAARFGPRRNAYVPLCVSCDWFSRLGWGRCTPKREGGTRTGGSVPCSASIAASRGLDGAQGATAFKFLLPVRCAPAVVWLRCAARAARCRTRRRSPPLGGRGWEGGRRRG
jgi:hypothetical protein